MLNVAFSATTTNELSASASNVTYLIVRVLEIIDGFGVPVDPDAEEPARPEAVFRHDDEVCEKSGCRLDKPHLRMDFGGQLAN